MNISKLTLSTAVIAATCAVATAQNIYNTSFESPDFALGSDGFSDGWLQGSNSGGNREIVNSYASSGSQSLRLGTTSGTSFHSNRIAVAPNGGIMSFSTKVLVQANNTGDRMASLLVSTGTMGGTVMGVSIDAGGVVRAGTSWGAVYSTGAIGTAGAGTFAEQWLNMSVTIDTATGDGSAVVDGFSSGGPIMANFSGINTSFGFLNLASDYSGGGEGNVFFDDVSIDAVPEPMTMTLLGAGALALLRRKKKA